MRHDALLAFALLAGCSDPTVAKDYLAVISVSPDQGATQVALDTSVVAGFSEALVGDTVDPQNIYITDETGGPVVATVSYVERAHWVTIDPEADLAPNSAYLVTFTTNIKGVNSGFLLAPVQVSFTTAGTNPSNELPIADAGPDIDGTQGETLVLDGTASSDPEGADLRFQWRIVNAPSDSTASLNSTTQPTVSITPDQPGEYIVGLTVNDGIQASSEDFVAIRVSSESGPLDTGTDDSDDETDTGSATGAPDTGR